MNWKNIKRTILALLVATLLLPGTAALAAEDTARMIQQGEACLQASPPEYEKAAQYFRRAGANGDPAGYYRLALMYETGLLIEGNPCTDDLEANGQARAREYYALAAREGYVPAAEKLADSYETITQEQAQKLLAEEIDYILLDVRTPEEYDAGHIPGAICVPVESITAPPEELRDYEQLILIYCRSGRRSKQAAEKLASLGYTDIREFGGILDWTGETVTTEEESWQRDSADP